MRNTIRIFATILAVVLMTGCKQNPQTKIYNPAEVQFKATYNPMFEGQLYPSLVMGLTNYAGADDIYFFNVSLISPADNAVLRIVIDSSTLNYVTICQEILPNKGELYEFRPLIKWKYENLYLIRQQGTTDLTFTCYINDEEVDIENIRITYRSVNECPLSIKAAGNKPMDFRWMFSAYVNEDHPFIEEVLTEIMNQGIINTVQGYQSGAKHVKEQVFAVWYYALDRGLAYSSISCTSNPSRLANVQHIRFFDQVYNTRQANCIDACVFFASILRKIGLKPVIFVEPCHAYLGYYTDRGKKNIELLETTITSWVNFPELEHNLDENGMLPEKDYQKVSKHLTPEQDSLYRNGNMDFETLKVNVARNLFDKATTYNTEKYKANKEHFIDTAEISYQQLDIENLRKLVQPIISTK